MIKLMSRAFAEELRVFLAAVRKEREASGRPILDSAAYDALPFATAVADDPEWRVRRLDLGVVTASLVSLPPPPLRILDVGCWNGWLSARLAALRHDVTGVDLYPDEHDGLGARRHYRTRWRAVQMDPLDLGLLGETYDVVILNRCLQFFPDPPAYLDVAMERVSPRGRLLVTGLQFLRDPSRKEAALNRERASFRDRHGLDLFLRPARGFLDFRDRGVLASRGLRLSLYPRLLVPNLKSFVRATSPRFEYGVRDAP